MMCSPPGKKKQKNFFFHLLKILSLILKSSIDEFKSTAANVQNFQTATVSILFMQAHIWTAGWKHTSLKYENLQMIHYEHMEEQFSAGPDLGGIVTTLRLPA